MQLPMNSGSLSFKGPQNITCLLHYLSKKIAALKGEGEGN